MLNQILKAAINVHTRVPVSICVPRVHLLKLATTGWAEGNQLPVICHNLSRGGIGFLCQMPLPVGQHVRAFVRLQAGENWVFEGQIARCRTHDDGWSDMGMQFANLTGTANRRIEPNPTDNTA